jgi:hypothetical protein
MPIQVHQLTKEEAKTLFEALKVSNRMPKELMDRLALDGWTFDDFSMEKTYKGYPLVIEFCIGDFCAYPCSKNGHYLLERKKSCENWFEALCHIFELQERIDNGEHWTGEND